MNKIVNKGILSIAAIGVMSAMLSGCGTSDTPSSNGNSSKSPSAKNNAKPVEGGTLTVDMNQAVPDLDPAVAYDATSAEVTAQLYEQLVTYDKTSYKIIGDLAKTWTVSNDGLTYTFHLRPGVKFSNGDPLSANDFVFELERILDKNLKPKPSPGNQFFMDIQGASAYYNGKAKTITGVSAPNDSTLVIKLVKPETFFLQILAMPFLSAVDPAYVKKVGNAAFDSTTAMGTGPFELVSNSQTKVVLKRNPHYWQKDAYGNQLPYLNQITLDVNPNTQVDELQWEQGTNAFLSPNLMGGDGIPTSQFNTIMNTPKYSNLVMKEQENSINYIGMNMKKKIDGKPNPLANLKVRQAIEYAFDANEIVKIEDGTVQSLNQPLPSGMPGYVKNLEPSAQYGLNIAKAKQLLKEAGYSNGLTIDYWDQNSPDSLRVDQAVQSMMQAIGIKLKLHEVSFSDFLAEGMSGNAQMYMSAWSQDFPDPSDFLNTLFNSNQIPDNNMNNYSNPQVDQELNTAEYMTNQQERNKLYAKVTNQVMADAAWVPVDQTMGFAAVNPWVHGFTMSPVLTDPLQYIWIDKNHS